MQNFIPIKDEGDQSYHINPKKIVFVTILDEGRLLIKMDTDTDITTSDEDSVQALTKALSPQAD